MTDREAAPFNTVISEEAYTDMDRVAEENFGASLETLASADPYLVYRLLRDVIIKQFTDPNAHSSSVNMTDGLRVNSDDDGKEAVAGAVRTILEAQLPVVIVKPIDVVLRVSRQQNTVEPILSFRVNPTDPAF